MVATMKTQVMRHESQTLISTVLGHVNAWRRAQGWSRETVVQAIVEAHEHIEAPALTGIRFEPTSTDQFTRMKANADRVFRWLDDQTKDNNLLPANFLPSILAAMPMDIRAACADDLLAGLGLGCRRLDGGRGGFDAVSMLRSVLKENSEAQQAIASLVDGATADELHSAQREITEAIEALQIARSQVEIILRQGVS